ncbi:ARMT1-like domain-containing protein [Desulfobacula sp.]|uniref:damage-control phosphatase ARMT1 family protein n=1 Tax=Desulfobacula sp. TaxID=2593537 RepID=UPI0026248EBD|nr:ARMT1-like domain-containing protein [Desulfobacula sp.]
MKTYNDCIPCLVRQALGAARLVTDKEDDHSRVLKLVLADMADMDMKQSPPMMARKIQQTIAGVTGNKDPYRELKKQFNRFSLELYPDLKAMVDKSATPLKTAIQLAIAGNIIDFGAVSNLDKATVFDTIDHAMTHEVKGDLQGLIQALARPERILWIADNAGEIVFDRLVLERIDLSRVIFVVRGGAVLNDATLEDAAETGISDLVTTIDSGAAIPGTVLGECSESFLQAFDQADLIISKGQGNYETLPHDDDRIFFLFKAKCQMVAGLAGVSLDDMVVWKRHEQQTTMTRRKTS